MSANEIYAAEVELLKVGSEMSKLRREGDIDGCAKMMHSPAALERAEEMSRQSDGLSFDYFDLKVATTHMTMCVTCAEKLAAFNCGEAKTLLASTKRAHPELARK